MTRLTTASTDASTAAAATTTAAAATMTESAPESAGALAPQPPRRLTVLQLVPALVSGGVERGTVEVAQALTQRGHRSIVVSAGGPMVEQLKQFDGSEHIDWPIGRKSLFTLRYVRKLRRLLEREHVDVVDARSRLPAWVGYLAWRRMLPMRRPHWITSVHSLYSVSPYSAVMTTGDRVVAISSTVEHYIRHHYPRTDPQRIRIIERGVDPADFPPGHDPGDAWRDRFYAEFPRARDRGPLLTLPGRIVRRKGHLDFVRMLAKLRAQGVECHALIVGGEDPHRKRYAQAVRSAVRDAGLEQHVTWTGSRNDMAAIYAESTIVYALSAAPPEAFGRTVIEALTVGTPVIGYDLAGVGETLAELCPAGRVELGDVDAAAARTCAFLDRTPEIAENRRFTKRAMLDKTLALYEELAGEPARRDGA